MCIHTRIITTYDVQAINWICYLSSAWFALELRRQEEAKLTGRENGGTRDKTIVMKIKAKYQSMNVRGDQINQIFGRLQSRRYFQWFNNALRDDDDE